MLIMESSSTALFITNLLDRLCCLIFLARRRLARSQRKSPRATKEKTKTTLTKILGGGADDDANKNMGEKQSDGCTDGGKHDTEATDELTDNPTDLDMSNEHENKNAQRKTQGSARKNPTLTRKNESATLTQKESELAAWKIQLREKDPTLMEYLQV